MIITGAPVEQLEFEEVDYWKEITAIMEWSKKMFFYHAYLLGSAGRFILSFCIPKYSLSKKYLVFFRIKLSIIMLNC